MTRPITLVTGQWADLPFEEVCRLASQWGYDGIGLGGWTISDHLEGQAVCDDPIDQRNRDIGEGVRFAPEAAFDAAFPCSD